MQEVDQAEMSSHPCCTGTTLDEYVTDLTMHILAVCMHTMRHLRQLQCQQQNLQISTVCSS